MLSAFILPAGFAKLFRGLFLGLADEGLIVVVSSFDDVEEEALVSLGEGVGGPECKA